MSEENRPTGKKKWYAKCFREEWLGEADFLKIGCSRTKRIKTHPTVNVAKLL